MRVPSISALASWVAPTTRPLSAARSHACRLTLSDHGTAAAHPPRPAGAEAAKYPREHRSQSPGGATSPRADAAPKGLNTEFAVLLVGCLAARGGSALAADLRADMDPYVAGLLTANATPFNVGSVGVSTMHVLKHLGTKKDPSGRITLPRDTPLPSEAQVRALKEQALCRLGHPAPQLQARAPPPDDVASSDSVVAGKAPKSHTVGAGATPPAAAAANDGRSPEPRRASQETPASPRSASFDGT